MRVSVFIEAVIARPVTVLAGKEKRRNYLTIYFEIRLVQFQTYYCHSGMFRKTMGVWLRKSCKQCKPTALSTYSDRDLRANLPKP